MAGSFLRQSTASQSRGTPPFVNDTDFKTAETALTINNTDVKLIVNGGASANKNSGGGTHRANGIYGLTFDATDTATVGEMEVSIVVAGALPVFMKFWVLEEAVYDALFAASAPGYLQPTTAGRTLDVSATGEAGIDWANVGSPTTSLNLSGTTIATVTNQLTAAAIATGVWQDSTAGDFTTASSIGKALYIANIAPGAAGGHLISGSNAGTTTFGALTVTGATTFTGAVTGTSGSNDLRINGAVPGATGGLFIAGTNAATTVTTSFTTTFTGNLTGSVGSVTGAVGSVTGLTTATIATAVLTTAMTESYAADGAAPTLAQASFLTMQILSESNISGTTMTVKKLDGTTTAATFTLNSSSTPTTITRAT